MDLRFDRRLRMHHTVSLWIDARRIQQISKLLAAVLFSFACGGILGCAAQDRVFLDNLLLNPARLRQSMKEPCPPHIQNIEIESSPQGSQVYFDGQRRGVTPISVQVLLQAQKECKPGSCEDITEKNACEEETGYCNYNYKEGSMGCRPNHIVCRDRTKTVCSSAKCDCKPAYTPHRVMLLLGGIDIRRTISSGGSVGVNFSKDAYQRGQAELQTGNLGMAKFYFEKVRDMGLAEAKDAIRELAAMQHGK